MKCTLDFNPNPQTTKSGLRCSQDITEGSQLHDILAQIRAQVIEKIPDLGPQRKLHIELLDPKKEKGNVKLLNTRIKSLSNKRINIHPDETCYVHNNKALCLNTGKTNDGKCTHITIVYCARGFTPQEINSIKRIIKLIIQSNL